MRVSKACAHAFVIVPRVEDVSNRGSQGGGAHAALNQAASELFARHEPVAIGIGIYMMKKGPKTAPGTKGVA